MAPSSSPRTTEPSPAPSAGSGTSDPEPPDVLLSLRSAVILLAAMTIAMMIGTLTYLAQQSVPVSVLAGLTAFGAVVLGLHKLLGR